MVWWCMLLYGMMMHITICMTLLPFLCSMCCSVRCRRVNTHCKRPSSFIHHFGFNMDNRREALFFRICPLRTVPAEGGLGTVSILVMDHTTDRVFMPVTVGITRSFTFPFWRGGFPFRCSLSCCLCLCLRWSTTLLLVYLSVMCLLFLHQRRG